MVKFLIALGDGFPDKFDGARGELVGVLIVVTNG
jgi:hypothetical protein